MKIAFSFVAKFAIIHDHALKKICIKTNWRAKKIQREFRSKSFSLIVPKNKLLYEKEFDSWLINCTLLCR